MIKKQCNKYQKKYRAEHKEYFKQYRKKYYVENKDECKKRDKIYREKHMLEYKIYQLSASAIYAGIRYRAKKLVRSLLISREDFIRWYKNTSKKCYYCNRSLEKIKNDFREQSQNKGRLSIDRKDNNEGYSSNNIVLACRRCNLIKGDYFTAEEMLVIAKTLYSNKTQRGNL